MAKWTKIPHETMLTPEKISKEREKELKGLSFYFDKNKNENYEVDFFSMTKAEIHQKYIDDIKLIDSFYVLEMIACCEAFFRYEYLYRCQNGSRDKLTRELLEVYLEKENKAHFIDDLLKIWKKYVSCSGRIMDQFIESVKYRDWLAHGRYWIPKVSTDKFDYQTVEYICFALINSLRNESKVHYDVLPSV